MVIVWLGAVRRSNAANLESHGINKLAKRSVAASENLGMPLYSEYVYGGCLAVWGAMEGENGVSVGDFISIEKLINPSRTTALHEFISGAIDSIDSEMFYDWPDLEIDTHRDVIQKAGLAYPTVSEKRILDGTYRFEDKSAVYGIISDATNRIITPSIFHTLFSDRNFISQFQLCLRGYLLENLGAVPEHALTVQKKLRRTHLPKWLKKGIFFRDKGICQLCGKDMSGLRTPLEEVHIDHIVPLAKYGNNDPTNFQLTCRSCNVSKGASLKLERARFIPYWQDE